MNNSKGAKTKSNAASKTSNVKKTAPIKNNEDKSADDERTGSPEIEKDEGVENLNKDDNDSNTVNNTTQGSKENEDEKDIDNKTDTDLFREEDINIAETETEVDVEATGTGKFVDEALDGERVKERDTLQRLVEENVRLERELTKNKEHLSLALYDRDDLQLQIEVEKQDNQQLKQQLEARDKEVLDLEDKLRIAEAEIVNARGENEPLDISPLMYDKVTLEKRLQDTQLKLKRKLNDGEEQDRQILRLQTELNDLHSLCEILKDHVNNKEKLESIMEEHEKKRELRDAENLTQKNTEDSSEEIIRRQEPKSQHKESKVCIIQ